jgi:thioredoxin reductase
MLDVIIVGGGPAGLSAALVLGRCRRKVLVCDNGRPRNRFAGHMHGYLSRDHSEPTELLRIGRDEILRYGVQFSPREAVDARNVGEGFLVRLDDGTEHHSRRLLLATGVSDVLPEILGLPELYGRSVHHCPYCDGWEHKDERIVALGDGDAAIGLALNLRTWSQKIIACTNGREPEGEKRAQAGRLGIQVRTERVSRLVAEAGKLVGIEFTSGPSAPCDALFFNTGQYQRSPLAERLGCRFRPDGGVYTSNKQCTDIPGLYLAGDADKDVQFVIVAAAEGATAAVAINKELQEEERGSEAETQ